MTDKPHYRDVFGQRHPHQSGSSVSAVLRLNFRSEFFNIFNHPSLGAP
jgi:hypothetical protein